jgi:hypothetical protein
MRHFRQEADLVVEVGCGAHASVPPHGEGEPLHHPGHLQLLEALGHVLPHQVHAPHHQGVDLGVQRVREGGNEDPGGEGRMLMMVEDDLWVPPFVELVGDVNRLLLPDHVPVTVDVVAHVLVPDLRGAGELVLRPCHAPVPVHHDGVAVGVHHGHEEEDDVIPDPAALLGLIRGHVVRQEGACWAVATSAEWRPASIQTTAFPSRASRRASSGARSRARANRSLISRHRSSWARFSSEEM